MTDLAATCILVAIIGAEFLEPPADRPWGVRQAVVADPEGQQWVLTQHVHDTDPISWFDQVFEPLLG